MYRHTCTSVDMADLCIHVQNTHIQDCKRWRQPACMAGVPDDGSWLFLFAIKIVADM